MIFWYHISWDIQLQKKIVQNEINKLSSFLDEYHLSGLFIGICTFLIIGLFHPVVVKAEYYWGTKCWWIFLILGVCGVIASLCVDNILLSSLLGVFAFSSFWTIKEVFEQEERVKKGWFPKNPKRKYKFWWTLKNSGFFLGLFAYFTEFIYFCTASREIKEARTCSSVG